MSWRCAMLVPEYFWTSAEISASVGLAAAAVPAASRQAAAAVVDRATCMESPWSVLSCEQLARDVVEGLEFERVPARVGQEHRRLLAGLALETDAGLDDESGARGLQLGGQGLPVAHLEHHAEMRHRHVVAVHRVVTGAARGARNDVADELVAEEVEIHPLRGAPSLGTAQQFAVEGSGGREVTH